MRAQCKSQGEKQTSTGKLCDATQIGECPPPLLVTCKQYLIKMGEKNNKKCRILGFSLGALFCECSLPGVTPLNCRRKYQLRANAHWTPGTSRKKLCAVGLQGFHDLCVDCHHHRVYCLLVTAPTGR